MAEGGRAITADTSRPSASRRPRGLQRSIHGKQGHIRDAVDGNGPKARIWDLDRDCPFVAYAAKRVENRWNLKVAITRQNAVAINCELTRSATQVRDLDVRQVLRREQPQVL